MTLKRYLLLGTSALLSSIFWTARDAAAAEPQGRIVRIAELEIDTAHLESYKAALKEEIETSLRVEPGVLTLFAVSAKDQPAQVRIFETYADETAYRAHLETPHFKGTKPSRKRWSNPSNWLRLPRSSSARSFAERLPTQPSKRFPTWERADIQPATRLN